jgi:CDP-diacylglycerol--glycerol-3-phosphate 3-phosphatidyltransferase
VRWLATAVTATRGLLGPVVAWLVVHDHGVLAFEVFVFAICTDFVDGWVARRWGSPPGLGDWLDPVADKVLTTCAWVALGVHGWAPVWLCALTVVRDVAVVVGWVLLRVRGRRWRAGALAQIATAYQGTALAILVFHGPWLDVHWPSVGTVLGTAGLLLSLGALLSGPTANAPVSAAQ